MRTIYWLCLILTIIGGINWGLVGAANIDLVAMLFGVMTPLTKLVYVIVGVAAVVLLVLTLSTNRNLNYKSAAAH